MWAMNFDDMQAVWRTQEGHADLPPLVRDLQAFERYERRVTEIKLALVAALTLGSAPWLIARSLRSPLFAGGTIWCLATITVVAVLMWRARFTPWREGIEQPTSIFLDRAAAALRREERAARLYVCALVLSLVAGLNVMLAGLGSAGVVDHVIASLGPPAACAIGLWIRGWHLGRRNRALLRLIAEVRGRLAEPAEP
jgi:hypothetical protein